MLIVDSRRGCFYQKCFDPDCRAARARSNEFPLPCNLIQMSQLPDGPPYRGSASENASDSIPLLPPSCCQISQASSLSMEATSDEDEEWSQDILASVDQFLRERGLAVQEDEEWNDAVLADIDDFLRKRQASGHQAEGGDGAVAGCEGGVSQGDGAVASQCSTSEKGRFGEADRPCMSDEEESADNGSFDLDCIRALEEAELSYNKTRLAKQSEACAGSSQ